MTTRHAVINGQLRHMAGWHRDRYDPRDTMFRPLLLSIDMPSKGSVRSLFAPPIRDQGDIGSCTANGGVEAAGFISHIETSKPDPMFSRLDLYAITRTLEGTPLAEDSGCQVRDVFKAMAQSGVCLESIWPYITTNFSIRPPRAAAVQALQHKALVYSKAPTLIAIKSSIVDPTQPAPLIGGKGMLEFRNSWGTGWGLTGCGRLPYAYVTQGLASDFWRLTKNAA